MRGLVEDTKKLTLKHNNNNNTSTTSTTTTPTFATTAKNNNHSLPKKTNIVKTKTNNNQNNNNNTNMASTNTASKTVGTVGSNSNITMRKIKARPKSTDCKTLQQQSEQGATTKGVGIKTQQQQMQRPKSSIITGSISNNTSAPIAIKSNNNNNTNSNNNNNNSTNSNNNTITLPKAAHANTMEEIAGSVQDTIYLCNFRVSVDGEWLCLKELQDLDCNHTTSLQQQTACAPSGTNTTISRQASYAAWQKNKRYSGMSSQGDENGIHTNILARHNFIYELFI